jgi:hypothetical protein
MEREQCVEIELHQGGSFREVRGADWDWELSKAQSIRLCKAVDVPGYTAFEVDRARGHGGGTRRFLVPDPSESDQ